MHEDDNIKRTPPEHTMGLGSVGGATSMDAAHMASQRPPRTLTEQIERELKERHAQQLRRSTLQEQLEARAREATLQASASTDAHTRLQAIVELDRLFREKPELRRLVELLREVSII